MPSEQFTLYYITKNHMEVHERANGWTVPRLWATITWEPGVRAYRVVLEISKYTKHFGHLEAALDWISEEMDNMDSIDWEKEYEKRMEI